MTGDAPADPTGGSASVQSEFLREALAGLTRLPKRVPGKFLWDEAGSVLFDRICDHPDYYPSKREMLLLPRVADELAGRLGPKATIVEFGSGANRKIRTLLDALIRPVRVISVDISRDYLEASARRLAADYPAVAIIPVCADYARPIELPVDPSDGPVLGFFPGTSIGNMTPAEAEAFLRRARDTLGRGLFLIGADPTQEESRLRSTYGACGGLMSALHLNLLARMNRELGAGFDPADFRHELRVLQEPFRVEAHLVARRRQRHRLGDTDITIEADESILTDTSHKYAPDEFRALAERSGWNSERTWLDVDGLFSLHLLSA